MNHHDRKFPPIPATSTREATRRKIAKRAVMPMVLLAAVLPALTLSGCANHSRDHFVVGSVPENYKTKHPIVLQEQEQTLDIPVASQSYDLPVAAKSAVEGFAFEYRRSANGVISILLPSGSPNEAAARRVATKISDVMRGAGIPRSRISTITYHAADHGASAPVRLSYGAISASVDGCGKWTKDLTQSSENRNYQNFGCASQNNLAAMISNPADLLGPRGMTGIDAARRGKVIEDYRDAKEPNTPDTTYTKIQPTYTKGVE